MTFEVEIDGANGQIQLNGSTLSYASGDERLDSVISVVPSGPHTYSLLIGQRNYRVTVLSDTEISVNGRTYVCEIKDPRAFRSGSVNDSGHGRKVIGAPMPGRVVKVLVARGDAVTNGQGLVVVEAMKMQNELKSPRDGNVTEIRVEEGSAVAAGEALIVIE